MTKKTDGRYKANLSAIADAEEAVLGNKSSLYIALFYHSRQRKNSDRIIMTGNTT
ncbi:hypothetical protein [Nostoc sp.]|uniref:hypothetical protein n=1 Tax=Nostoc sp. TaxID=1180 RepID=UPI002FF4BFCE